MARKPQTGMMGALCLDCFTYHGPPRCEHNPDAACERCGLSVGLRCDGLPHGVCWNCFTGRPRSTKAAAE